MSKTRRSNIFTDNFYRSYLPKLRSTQKYKNILSIPKDLSVIDKFTLIKNVLNKELWELYEFGDHRTMLRGRIKNNLSPQDSFCTPYGTTLFPHPSELFINGLIDLTTVNKKGIDKAIQGLKLSKNQINRFHVEICSCTGCSPDIKSYQYGIKIKKQLSDSRNYHDFIKKCNRLESCIRKSIKDIFELPQSTKVLFSLSGTDAELILPLFGVKKNYITKETGSGTKYSAQALHSSNITWYGERLKKGGLVDKELVLEKPEIFPVRKSNEKVLSAIEHYKLKLKFLEKENLKNTDKIIGLHITTHTKTGEGTLTLKQALNIRKRFGFKRIILFADAAQTHLTRKEISNLINHDIIVSITGSKRPGGPMFTNAILLSPKMAGIMKNKVERIGYIYRGYSKYFVRGDFRSVIDDKYLRYFPDIPNFPQLIKWQVSLSIMKKFYAYNEKMRINVEKYIQLLIKRKLKTSKLFKLTKSSVKPKKYDKDIQNHKINHIISFHIKLKGKYLQRKELERFQYLMNHDISKYLDKSIKFTEKEQRILGITGLFGQRVQEGREPASMRISPSMGFFNSIFIKNITIQNYKKITKSIFISTIDRLIDKAILLLKFPHFIDKLRY